MYIIGHVYDEAVKLCDTPNIFVTAVKEVVTDLLTSDDYDECYLDVLSLYLFFEQETEQHIELTKILKKLTCESKAVSPKYFDKVDNYKQILKEKIEYIDEADDDTAYLLMRFIIDNQLFDDSLVTMKVARDE